MLSNEIMHQIRTHDNQRVHKNNRTTDIPKISINESVR